MLRAFFFQYDKFIFTGIEGLRTEDVVHVADWKAHWGNMIVIFLAALKQLRWFYLTMNGKRRNVGSCGDVQLVNSTIFLIKRGSTLLSFVLSSGWVENARSQRQSLRKLMKGFYIYTHTHTLIYISQTFLPSPSHPRIQTLSVAPANFTHTVVMTAVTLHPLHLHHQPPPPLSLHSLYPSVLSFFSVGESLGSLVYLCPSICLCVWVWLHVCVCGRLWDIRCRAT